MLYDELTPSQKRQCTRCRNGYIDQIADLKAEVQRLENNVRVYSMSWIKTKSGKSSMM